MSRTIGHHRPADMPLDDIVLSCDICGTRYFRSQMRRDRSGALACDKDYGGDVTTISEENAQGAMRPLVAVRDQMGGNIDVNPVEPPPSIVFPDGVPGFTQ